MLAVVEKHIVFGERFANAFQTAFHRLPTQAEQRQYLAMSLFDKVLSREFADQMMVEPETESRRMLRSRQLIRTQGLPTSAATS